MRTFKEFLELTEKYYDPDEKLPSGRTPFQKAADRAGREYTNTKNGKGRQMRQTNQVRRKVMHGADNPQLNRHHQPGFDISSGRNYLDIADNSTNIRYSINKHGKTNDGKDVYDVQWRHHYNTSKLNDNDRKRIARDAKTMWDNHVQHRLPYGSVLKNSPVGNPTSENPTKNTRAKLYQRAGFGEVGLNGRQFAQVGREPSRKQRLKGKKRLKPLPSNTEFDMN